MSIAIRPILQNTCRTLVLFPRARANSTSAAAAKTHGGGAAGGGEHKVLDPEFVNSPLSTLPAALELPQKAPGDSTFPYLIKTGKAYLGFYKSGLKNVYKNFIATRPIQSRIDEKGSITDLVGAGGITRREFQLVMRSRHDSRRIPIFGLVFIIFGEMSPFVLPFISGIVPFNCRIPRQIHRDRTKLEERRAATFRNLPRGRDLLELAREKRSVRDLTSNEVLHCSTVLGLHSGKWPSVLYPFLPPMMWLRFKLWRRLMYLELDDTLLARGGGPGMLDSGEELKMAAVDRGFDTLQKTETRLREELKLWLKAKETAGGMTPALWLTRPIEWRNSFPPSTSSPPPSSTTPPPPRTPTPRKQQ
ncbi:unnamed protein product [Tuber melanosporum]|uniref:(Perigord truffle) hypothetical protein n=1 Tax=Tuber melanosporum (strain Mel28) TaxID=656061 RepID=D5GGQ6_TUBMM|nr:uncharacterized protein GSTUM_00007468001 [Tuber melanosporum]CAZ83678.1 unnamed protein product [Tuber melanosporum]